MIKIPDHWLAKAIGAMSDHDLRTLFSEINDFRTTGVLKEGSMLRTLANQLAEEKGIVANIRATVEDAILIEMARRYHNNTERMVTVVLNGDISNATVKIPNHIDIESQYYVGKYLDKLFEAPVDYWYLADSNMEEAAANET